MDAIVPLLVLAYAVWSRVGRRVLRRDDVGRAVAETVARLRQLAADAGVPTPPRGAAVRTTAPAAPAVAAAPAVPTATVTASAPPVPPAPAAPLERVPPERVVPAERVVQRPPVTAAPVPAATAVPGAAGGPARRRRLDVRRDLVAAELLAAPVALRQGDAAWR